MPTPTPTEEWKRCQKFFPKIKIAKNNPVTTPGVSVHGVAKTSEEGLITVTRSAVIWTKLTN